MGILTPTIQQFVRQQKLGYVATVCPDGTPNLSPKGTTTVWDDHHLVFADIHSPETTNNLLKNPAVEVNIVDIFTRKGYRFKGTANVLSKGPQFEKIMSFYKDAGLKYIVNNIILIKVKRVLPLFSPVYDTGMAEDKVVERWIEYWNKVYAKK